MGARSARRRAARRRSRSSPRSASTSSSPTSACPTCPGSSSSGTGAAIDPAVLQRIFRAAHSLKGLAGMFGATAVSTLAHALEDLLDALRLGRERVTREVLDLLFEVPGVLESLLAGQPADEAAA